MFDRYIHGDVSGPSHVTQTVHEHRAPTDESVRLLREMEQKARDQVVQAIRLEDSPIDCIVHVQDNAMNAERDFCAYVRINGKRLEVRKSFPMDTSADVMARGLMESVATKIAIEILAKPFAALGGKIR
jgi:hypothetical protein